jgi:His/Glu/Gln/Arg/opine family amino acid ABC transporter permease subunit
MSTTTATVAMPPSRGIIPMPGGPRGLAIQVVLLVAVIALGWWFWSNAQANMAARGLQFGYAFLDRSAGIPIGESIIPYTPADTYRHALTVGLLNTLRVAIVGIALCTVIGILLGLARLSANPLLRSLVGGYIEVIRNTPFLVQLFFFFFALPAIGLRWSPQTAALVAMVVSMLAVAGIEGRTPARRAEATAPTRFGVALREVWAEPVARHFTIFVFVSMLAYSAQDLILEPFAGLVFGLTPGQSTKLSGVQNSGVLMGMVLVAISVQMTLDGIAAYLGRG